MKQKTKMVGHTAADGDGDADKDEDEDEDFFPATLRKSKSEEKGPCRRAMTLNTMSTAATESCSQWHGSNVGMEAVRDPSDEVPLTILLVRHGESEGNVNPGVYDSIPDHAIPLTERGKLMARKAGEECRKYIEKHCPEGGVKMWVSPFLRTRITAQNMLHESTGLAPLLNDICESPLLVEQDYGLFE